jgi:bacterioferritin
MNALEKALRPQVPLHEAAGFFLRLKTAADEGAPAPGAPPPGMPGPAGASPAPDETGQLEGEFAAPVEQVLAAMTQIAENEFKTMLAYHVYAQSLRDLSREGIAEEFEEHAEDEIHHADFILRRMSVLGGPVQLPDIPAPAPASDPTEIVQTMIAMEQAGIALWQTLLPLLGENPTKYKVEEFLTREQHHLDELWQLLPHQPGGAVAPTAPAPSDQALNSAIQQPSAEAPKAESAAPAIPPVNVKVGRRLVPFRELPKLPAEMYAQAGEKLASAGKSAGSRLKRLAERRGEKVAFLEKMHPGTEHYHSDRMRAALEGMSAKVYLPGIDLMGEKLAGAYAKLADVPMNTPGQVPPASTQSPGGGFEGMPDHRPYLANETAARGAEEQASTGYYQQRFQEAAAKLKELETSTQGLQQQLEQSNAQIQQSMQSAQAAQSTASQALQQQLTSADQALQTQQQAAAMRQAYQTLRGQMMDIASQDPAAEVGAQLSGSAAQAAQVPGQAPGQAPGAPAPADPNAGGAPGAAPTSGPPTADAGPAGQAAGAQSAPGAAPPEGETSAQNPANADGAQGADRSTAQPSTHVSIKTSGVMDSTLVQGALKRLPYAAAGGALGTGSAMLESGAGADKLRSKVQELEGKPGGFGHAMNLAQSKFRLALGDAGEKHPGGAALAGGLTGAMLGAAAGPGMHSQLRSAGKSLKDIKGAF